MNTAPEDRGSAESPASTPGSAVPRTKPDAEAASKADDSGSQVVPDGLALLNVPETKKAEVVIPEIPKKILVAALSVVLLFDYVIYQGPGKIGGVGCGLLLLLLALIVWLVECPHRSRAALFCCALIFIFALRTIWQSALTTEVVGFFLLFVFASALKKFSLHVCELCHSLWWTVAKIPVMLVGFGKGLSRPIGKLPPWGLKGLRAGLTWLIPILVVLVFLSVFSAANIVVESWVSATQDWIWEQFVSIFDYLSAGRIFFWICSFLLAAVLLLPQRVTATVLTPFLGEEETMQPCLVQLDSKASVAVRTLVAVNLLFLWYLAIDISFLWLQKALPEGVTYSEYARSGTFWLTVALALTSLVLGIMFSRGLNFHPRTRLLKTLAWIWVIQNLVLALVVFQRLLIYVNYNGLTRLRIVGVYGIALVVVGLLVVAYKMHRARSFLWMIRRHLLAFALALYVLAITPMDWLVFRYNAWIILNDNPRCSIQLIVQPITAEGIPALIPLLDCPDEIIREGVAGLLLREQKELEKLTNSEERWLDGELSRPYALGTIISVRRKIDRILPDGDWQKAVERLHEHARRWY